VLLLLCAAPAPALAGTKGQPQQVRTPPRDLATQAVQLASNHVLAARGQHPPGLRLRLLVPLARFLANRYPEAVYKQVGKTLPTKVMEEQGTRSIATLAALRWLYTGAEVRVKRMQASRTRPVPAGTGVVARVRRMYRRSRATTDRIYLDRLAIENTAIANLMLLFLQEELQTTPDHPTWKQVVGYAALVAAQLADQELTRRTETGEYLPDETELATLSPGIGLGLELAAQGIEQLGDQLVQRFTRWLDRSKPARPADRQQDRQQAHQPLPAAAP
jgi:hypothetical protein